MSCPIFVHVMANGDIWVSATYADTIAGTLAGTFRVNGTPAVVKLGTISGVSPNYSVSGANTKDGRDISGR